MEEGGKGGEGLASPSALVRTFAPAKEGRRIGLGPSSNDAHVSSSECTIFVTFNLSMGPTSCNRMPHEKTSWTIPPHPMHLNTAPCPATTSCVITPITPVRHHPHAPPPPCTRRACPAWSASTATWCACACTAVGAGAGRTRVLLRARAVVPACVLGPTQPLALPQLPLVMDGGEMGSGIARVGGSRWEVSGRG